MTRNNTYWFRFIPWLFLVLLIPLVGCSFTFSSERTIATELTTSLPLVEEPTYTTEPASTLTSTPTATLTLTSSPTQTTTPSLTPSPSPSPTITPTPTSEFPIATALMQANCRYGPGKAYLYAHGLYPGDIGIVDGRNYSGTWLWIKPYNLEWHCWVAASVVDVVGDVKKLKIVQSRLPHSTLYGPPERVNAVRRGDTVVISWSKVWMTADDDRGYLIEAKICRNGSLIFVAMHTEGTTISVQDENGCSKPSSGKLYTVEKHGYTDPVEIPWPQK